MRVPVGNFNVLAKAINPYKDLNYLLKELSLIHYEKTGETVVPVCCLHENQDGEHMLTAGLDRGSEEEIDLLIRARAFVKNPDDEKVVLNAQRIVFTYLLRAILRLGYDELLIQLSD